LSNTYAADDKWKYLVLPYFDVKINERVFLNGERARTMYATDCGFPGLPETVDDLSLSPLNSFNATAITPNSAFPLLLHPTTRAYGVAWYASVLQGDRMQGPIGANARIDTSGNIFIRTVIFCEIRKYACILRLR
jgi:hypothetical protein